MVSTFLQVYFLAIIGLVGKSDCSVEGSVTPLGPILKPQNDKKEYKALRLANNLTVVLISEKSIQKSAASLSVAAGSLNDPPEFLGLAHYMEHCIFLGNEQFPEENSYEKFLSSNGGSDNAATSGSTTWFYFDVAPTAFNETLQRFAAMFVAPLFKESALEREVQAVDSEYRKSIPVEARRRFRIQEETANRSHPHSQFSTGSMETLWLIPKEKGLSIPSALHQFYNNFYSANLMNLVVMGPQSVPELESMVSEYFSRIPSHQRQRSFWPSPIGSEEIGERIDVEPIGDTRDVLLTFPLEYAPEFYRDSPLGYMDYILDLEGKGSLYAHLKAKGWIESLTSYVDTSPGYTLMEIYFTLTIEGLARVEDLVLHFFEYLKMVRDAGPQKWIWEEIRELIRIRMRYREELGSASIVQKLSRYLVSYPVEKILYADEIDEDNTFEEDKILKLLEQLNTSNFRMLVTCKECNGEKMPYTEHFYKIRYNRYKLDPALIQKWTNCEANPNFQLPSKNEFIPTRFELKPRDELSVQNPDTPRKLLDTNLSQVWYLQDTQFFIPKAIISVEILTPLAFMDPGKTTMFRIFLTLVIDALWEFKYSGQLAELDCSLGYTTSGMKMVFKGYDDKLADFMYKIFHQIFHFQVDAEHFERAKQTHTRYLRNRRDEEPSLLVDEQLRELLLGKWWSTSEMLEEIQTLQLSALSPFIEELMLRLKFSWTFHGNLSPEEAIRIARDCEEPFVRRGTLPLFPTQVPLTRVIEIPRGSKYLYRISHPTHSSSGTAILFQIGPSSPTLSILAYLLVRLLKVPSYDRLRTKEQLGYHVNTEVYIDDDSVSTYSIRILVQGTPHPAHVESRIDKFLSDFWTQHLEPMGEGEFNLEKESQKKILSVRPSNLGEKAGHIFREVHSNREAFDFKRQQLDALEWVVLRDLQHFYKHYILGAKTRKRLSIHVVGMAEGGAGTRTTLSNPLTATPQDQEIIEDPISWKRELQLFPSLYHTPKGFKNSLLY